MSSPDQPQQVGKHRSLQQIQPPGFYEVLPLVFDTAAPRGLCQMRLFPLPLGIDV